MLCEFAAGARGTFEASRSIVGPESQMAFEVYGTKGALGWNLEKLNELQLYLVEDELHTGYRTVFGGDRFPYHGHFVPGQRERDRLRGPRRDRGLRVLPLGRRGPRARARASPRRVEWVSVQAALLRSAETRPLGGRRLAAGGLMERHADALRIGVIGVGRIGRMHAELLARQVPGAAVTRGPRRASRRARAASPSTLGVRAAGRRRGAARRARRRRGRDLHVDRHARRPDRRRRRGRQGDLLREAGVARPRRGRPRAGRRRGRRRAVPDRLQPPLRPRARGGRRRGRRRRGRRAAARAHHQPRPRAAADRVRPHARAGSSST